MARMLNPKPMPGMTSEIDGTFAWSPSSQWTVGLMQGLRTSPGNWQATSTMGWPKSWSIELMSGAEAVAQGMFSRAMPKGELLENTRGIVAKVATGATGAFNASKELVAHIRDQRLGQPRRVGGEE